jgi:Leucine-rich repeat (LRR) protein
MTIDFNQYLKDGKLDLRGKRSLFVSEANVKEFTTFITEKGTEIVDLNLNNCYLGSKIISIIDSIKGSSITTLHINSNRIGVAETKEIAKLTNLTSLDIGSNNLGHNEAKEIANKLPNLTNLNISDNKIGDDGAKEITKLAKLTNLDISWIDIRAGVLKELANLPNLTNLNIRNNGLETDHLKEIAKLPNLNYLNISNNNIGDEGAAEVAKLPNLTSLVISDNYITADGAKDIAKLTNLTSLNIGMNNLGVDGAKELANLPNLTSLNIDYGNIEDAGAKELAKLLNLTNLVISHNHITADGAKVIGNLVNLTNLDIRENSLGNFGATWIAKLPNLTDLSINDNSLSLDGIEELASNLNIRNIKISHNHLDIETYFYSVVRDAYNNNKIVNTERMFEIAQNDDEGKILKYLLDRPEQYVLPINSRDREGHSLLHFYNNNQEMQQYLFEHGAIPEKEKNEQGQRLGVLAANIQGVHDTEITKQNHFIVSKLVESYGQNKEELLKEAASYKGTVKNLAENFSDLEIGLLSLSEKSNANTLYKRDVNNNLMMQDTSSLSDKEVVKKITKKVNEVLQSTYLNSSSGYYTHQNAYNNNGSTITIPETIGLVNHDINNREIPIADKKELLVTLLNQNPNLLEDKSEILFHLLGKEATKDNLTNRAKCHQLIKDTDPSVISKAFKDISGLDIDQTLRKQQAFALAEKLYWAATNYGDNDSACIGGTWTQIVNAAAEIEPKYLDAFANVKEAEAAQELLKKDINPTKIAPFIKSLSNKLVDYVKEKPELKEALVEFAQNSVNLEEPNGITINQQRILGKINEIFGKEIKSHLPNYNMAIPKLEEYSTIINALPKSLVLETFTKVYTEENSLKLQEEAQRTAKDNPNKINLEKMKERMIKQEYNTNKAIFDDVADSFKPSIDDKLIEIKQNLEGKLKRSNSQPSSVIKDSWADRVKAESNSLSKSPTI